jgi:biotin carboxylase
VPTARIRPATAPADRPLNVLCVASYEKGQAFLRECKRQGCRVLLLTSKSLEGADWPRESLDDIYYIPDVDKEWNMPDVIHGVSYLARTVEIDRIVPLDDFDVEKAALLREHLRVPGMGDTTARYFRDKLAMRMKAEEAGIPVPPFSSVINYDRLRAYLAAVPPPYVLKPRTQAGAIGIRKVATEADVWTNLNELGDRQSYYLLEKFVPGEIYHVDTIIREKKVVFSLVSKYGAPPLQVSHEGRVFSTRNVPRGTPEEAEFTALNKRVLEAFGMVRGVSHSEYIKGADGTLYFLETSARVAGAHIAEMVEAATGLNLWAEWAKIECRRDPENYPTPKPRKEYAGLLVSLAKQERPDLSAYADPEVYWKMEDKTYHAGVVVRSPDYARVSDLLTAYTERFYQDFFTSLPPLEKAVD